MPYRHANYFIAFVLLITAGGFWASYFTRIGNVPFAFHLHAFSATSWLLLLLAQNWVIQKRHNQLHRVMGRASFLLFPLLIMGFVAIVNVAAARYAGGNDDRVLILGPAFGIGMAVAISAYLVLFYLALRNRQNIRLHAGYMLATPLILFESPFSRIMGNAMPWMNFIGSEGPRAILDTIAISDLMAIIFAMTLYFRSPKHGQPWLIASAFMGLQAVLMWFAPDIPLLSRMFAAYTAVPPPVTFLCALVLALAVTWAGWQRGSKQASRPQAAAA